MHYPDLPAVTPRPCRTVAHRRRGNITLTVVVLTGLAFQFPAAGAAQTAPIPGDRIRITQADGTVVAGTLATWSANAVRLSPDRLGGTVDIPAETIDVFETSLSRETNFAKHFANTVGFVAAAGGVIGAATWSPCEPTTLFGCVGASNSRGQAFLVGAGVLGIALGVPIGVLRGFGVKDERWRPVALPPRTEPGLAIRPLIGNGVGLAASMPVGHH